MLKAPQFSLYLRQTTVDGQFCTAEMPLNGVRQVLKYVLNRPVFTGFRKSQDSALEAVPPPARPEPAVHRQKERLHRQKVESPSGLQRRDAASVQGVKLCPVGVRV